MGPKLKAAVLFSGGKDSCAALEIAKLFYDVKFLINIFNKKEDSYLYHTINNNLIDLQAKAVGINLIKEEINLDKEEELKPLILLFKKLKEKGIEVIISGAIESVYQASRFEKASLEADLLFYNPLWKINQEKYVSWINKNFKVLINKVAAYPLTKEFIGKELIFLEERKELLKNLIQLSGEGGEYETICLNAPSWEYEIIIEEKSIKEINTYESELIINNAKLVKKNHKTIINDLKELDYDVKNNDLLIINSSDNPLNYFNYAKPIAKITGGKIISWDDLNKMIILNHDLSNKKFIISGTALLDFSFEDKINLVKSLINKKPKKIIGICAGAQLLTRIYEGTVFNNEKIGLNRVLFFEKNNSNNEIREIEVYENHLQGIIAPKDAFIFSKDKENNCKAWKKNNITAFLFHPEVRNEDLLRKELL